MSWSEGRRHCLLAGLVLLAGCTIRPLHGTLSLAEGGIAPKVVALTPIPGRQGYLFRQALARRFDLEPDARYALDVALSLRESGLAITSVGDITRFNLEGTAQFVLRDTVAGTPVLEGAVRSISAYNALASAFATRVARDDAEARVMADLAQRIFVQVKVRTAATG